MQRAVLQQATLTGFQTQATRVVPGHGTGFENQAVNDDSFRDDSFRDDYFGDNCHRDDPCQKESSRLMLVVSVLANAIGGSLLLSGMYFLPHLIAGILS
jgi:hypothetical protein